ncbi:XdhC family protein [Robiginitomaculum antarcticum]|uniref:XdhC family protein n=1 Tax=Robiginitomaculum antarcticum TaxID=437507 RepID=UPI000369288B|nr:XdhC family protein [Robiginitomaculum antarcticum]
MTYAAHPEDILRFACARDDVCLGVITRVTGGAMRPEGALFAVTESGGMAGYVSNGCVDADIIAQARAALADGERRDLIYGEGSPFFDIVLPCGGAIALTLIPGPDRDIMSQGLAGLINREAVTLDLGLGSPCVYHPRLRLRISGRGAALIALARLATESGFLVDAGSPDIELKMPLGDIAFTHLNGTSLPGRGDDKWTAHVMLFHDHDYELPLLKAALGGPAFFIGAMGSRQTQAARRERLAELGISAAQIDRVRGPVGLIPSLRDARQLGVSILAQIIQTAQDGDLL